MSTTTLPGWLQVVLMWLVGVVGWLLLRPYRRITQMGGKDATAAISSAGSWHRRFLRDARDAARLEVVTPGGTAEPRFSRARRVEPEVRVLRPESRLEDVPSVSVAPDAPRRSETSSTTTSAPRRRPAGDWTEADVPDSPSNYTIYRPASSPAPTPSSRPVRRPESSPVGG